MGHDSLIGYRAKLVEAGIAKELAFDAILEQTKTLITKICRLAIVDSVSPPMNLVMHPDQIGDLMFSNTRMEKMEDRPVEVNHPMAENPCVQQIAKKVPNGSWMRFMKRFCTSPRSSIRGRGVKRALFALITCAAERISSFLSV